MEASKLEQVLDSVPKKVGQCISAPTSNHWFVGKIVEFSEYESRLIGKLIACGKGFLTSKLCKVEEYDDIICYRTESGSMYSFKLEEARNS